MFSVICPPSGEPTAAAPSTSIADCCEWFVFGQVSRFNGGEAGSVSDLVLWVGWFAAQANSQQKMLVWYLRMRTGIGMEGFED